MPAAPGIGKAANGAWVLLLVAFADTSNGDA
jgi:hypothetical protein